MKPLIAFAVLALLAGSVAQADDYGQPPEERAAQAKLPQSPDGLWKVLAKTKINEDDKQGIFTAEHPAAVKALAGKTLTMTGFMLPIQDTEKSDHFLLTRYTPVCPFCPPGAPNEVVEVHTSEPVEPSADLIKVTGTFSLEDNGEKGLFFQLSDAHLATAPETPDLRAAAQ